MRLRACQFLKTYNHRFDKTDAGAKPQLAPLFSSICDSSLPDSEKDIERLAQEGFVMIVAGGETVSRVLSITMFYILSHPHVLQALREEIMTVMPDVNDIPPAKSLEKLPYLVTSSCWCKVCNTDCALRWQWSKKVFASQL